MLENFQYHQGQSFSTAGESLDKADAVMILVHGRGASAKSILTLTDQLERDGFSYLAPQATNATCYPNSFLAPISDNEPWLSSALKVLEQTIKHTQNAGIPANRTIFLGFSQGACLALEFIARHPKRYGGVAALSGGLIGPPGMQFSYPGSLDNTPIFIGCSDIDPHIPMERVNETTIALRRLCAEVTEQIYPGMGHIVNQDEIVHILELMDKIAIE